ncbi:putative cytochrome P450 monooxygenase [Xylaria nigripes]|nr:putative cytochrome P450 monooxygenase [Xylaria nigripes]
MPFPRDRRHVDGTLPFVVRKLHKRYGPIVRIAPDELVFCSTQAWQDIYGVKKVDRRDTLNPPELPKYNFFYRVFDNIPISIINADYQEHSMLRRELSHGFSDRSLREQEPIIGSYINLFISRLKTEVQKTSFQNMREWYNWTTFDLIGDLSFGVEGGFGCLQKLETHRWVTVITKIISHTSKVQALCRLGLRQPMMWLSRSGFLAENEHQKLVYEKVRQRMGVHHERPDFLEGLIRNKEELGLDHARLATTAANLVIAGSETTASVLCGATYFLTMHPDILEKLQREVRSMFKSDDAITLTSVNDLSYLLACLNESLRCYPPVAAGLPRQVPRGGTIIDGMFVPEGAVVSVHQWSINYEERFWTEPELFAPERWLGDPKYRGDQLNAMQPFSVGPRNCIGRSLAYAEMRLILAKVIYNFDISIDDSSRYWLRDQKVFELWDKPPLNIHLKPVARRSEVA